MEGFKQLAIMRKGGPIKNCWGFIDGTARAICRPSINQQEYYSGHKRLHCLKYQLILIPDGMMAFMDHTQVDDMMQVLH
ncbi:hypothetical protein J437_LFUL012517 [Ladona fulva]|uniref:DDE Tnp4 domain-containing protein n=1 Tax=Ladona fulva TaxID=123851 RepID=A0A8K0K242_LADFU|nr:hypothetical protein J437_LFUL012517 [Ladona fulva]